MIKSEFFEVKTCSFKKKDITVKGEYKESGDTQGLSLTDNENPHPDLLAERMKLGKIVAKIIELDEVTQKRCCIDKITVNRKTGEFTLDLAVLIPAIQPNPVIKVRKFNDITRTDAEPLLTEASMYICGEKRAQSAMEFSG